MKNFILWIILFALITGCSSSSSRSTNTIVPISPTILPTLEPTTVQFSRDCALNGVVTSDNGDIKESIIDIVSAESRFFPGSNSLTIILTLKDIPETITINKPEIPNGKLEFVWGISIDADGRSSTGYEERLIMGCIGSEYQILIVNVKTEKDIPKTGPMSSLLFEKMFLKLGAKGNHKWVGIPKMEVDDEKNTITLTLSVPNDIGASSRLCFSSYAGGTADSPSEQVLIDCRM